MPGLDIARLLEHTSADRKLRAYAYLTASFNATPNTSDVVDCFIPFIAAGVTRQAGQLLELDKLTTYLQTLGLRVPLYALRQLIPQLERLGLVEWNKAAKRHLCKIVPANGSNSLESSPGLEESFDAFEEKFKAFALNKGLERPPASDSWSDALIPFLRSEAAAAALRATTVRDTLVHDGQGIEWFLVARFIQEAQSSDTLIFDAIIKIYTGVLIEDFINNIQSVGDTSSYRQLSIYYDTTVLLRLLGTSGSILLSATMELHRSLQDLGCKCLYLDYAADEVVRILDTLVTNHELGGEIFGETSQAIIDGDITMGRIRDIRATLDQRLGELNIFPVTYSVAGRKSDDVFQIDENELIGSIETEAAKRRRIYKRASATTDARSVAIIIRLRKGLSRRSIASCGHLFVSHNPVLQIATRNFVINHLEGYEGAQIPPVLTLGQITTAAWLATARTLEAVNVTRELLATCYNAVRPNPAWTKEFSTALDTFMRDKPGAIEERANAALFLQIARNHARDESFNQPAVLRKANIAELFEAAALESDEKERSRASQIAEIHCLHRDQMERRALETAAEQIKIAQEMEVQIKALADRAQQQVDEMEQRHLADKAAAVESAAFEVSRKLMLELQQAARDRRRGIARTVARSTISLCRLGVAAGLAFLLYLLSTDHWETGTEGKLIASLVLALLLLLANLDLFGSEAVKSVVRGSQTWLESRLYNFLERDGVDPDPLARVEPRL